MEERKMGAKRMESVEVYLSEKGQICLKNDDYGAGEQIITFTPEQADTVIEWIRQAKEEALKNE